MTKDRTRIAAAGTGAGTPGGGNATGKTADVQRFAIEVASEIGVDPDNLGAFGLTREQIRQFESETHQG